jgi:NAD(P)-dependent dehydrogenase (short-subunit alcohol dehydrogenase family)
MRLQGKVAIVTGGGRGIGRSIALTFAREGAQIAVTARTEAEINAVADEIRALDRNVVAIACDVIQETTVNAMVEQVVKDLGEPDILVNNAGVIIVGDVASVETEKWKYGIAVSLTGAFLCSKAVLKYMIPRRSGKIINIASRAGKIPTPYLSSYSAAKFGLIGFTKSLSDEVKKIGINVNAICPGFVDTKMVRDVGFDKIIKDIMAPQDIADVALFLASEESKSIMGADIEVYGKTERPASMG